MPPPPDRKGNRANARSKELFGVQPLRNSSDRLKRFRLQTHYWLTALFSAPPAQSVRLLMSVRLVFLLCLLSILIRGAQGQCPSPPSGTLRLATGPEKGGYAKVGDFLRDLAERGDLRKYGIVKIELKATAGTEENLRLLETCSVELAMAQSDLFHETVSGHLPHQLGEKPSRIYARGYPLFAEFIQILVPPQSPIHHVKELNKKAVLLGLKNSGTAHTAEIILRTADADEAQKMPSDKVRSADEVLKAFNNGYSAAFFSSAIPNRVIRDLTTRDPEFRVIPLDNDLIRELIGQGAYIAASIPSESYWKHRWWLAGIRDEPAPPEDIATVAVEALLISRNGFESQLSNVVASLRKHRSEFKRKEHRELDLIVPFIEKPSTFWFVALLVGVYICLHVAVVRYKKTLRLHQEILVVFAFFISIWLLAAAGLWFFEHPYNPYFETYAKSCWSMLSYVAGRSEGRLPMTPQGEFLSMISFIFGAGLVAWFTAELSSRLVKGELGVVSRLLERRNSMLQQLRDHMVIFNWDERVPLIIRQMHHSSPPCVLVTPIPLQIPEDLSDAVIPIVGNAVDTEVLNKSRILECKSTVILSSWRTSDPNERRRLDADAADTKTIMTVMAIHHLQEKNGRQVRITAEIREERNLSSAQHCLGEHSSTELLCLQEFGMAMLAACAASPGFGALYSHLLHSPDGKAGIVQTPVPENLIGSFFSDALRWYAHLEPANGSKPSIPIGVFRDSRLYIGPDDSELGALIPGDRFFVIAGNANSRSKPTVRSAHASRKSA